MWTSVIRNFFQRWKSKLSYLTVTVLACLEYIIQCYTQKWATFSFLVTVQYRRYLLYIKSLTGLVYHSNFQLTKSYNHVHIAYVGIPWHHRLPKFTLPLFIHYILELGSSCIRQIIEDFEWKFIWFVKIWNYHRQCLNRVHLPLLQCLLVFSVCFGWNLIRFKSLANTVSFWNEIYKNIHNEANYLRWTLTLSQFENRT